MDIMDSSDTPTGGLSVNTRSTAGGALPLSVDERDAFSSPTSASALAGAVLPTSTGPAQSSSTSGSAFDRLDEALAATRHTATMPGQSAATFGTAFDRLDEVSGGAANATTVQTKVTTHPAPTHSTAHSTTTSTTTKTTQQTTPVVVSTPPTSAPTLPAVTSSTSSLSTSSTSSVVMVTDLSKLKGLDQVEGLKGPSEVGTGVVNKTVLLDTRSGPNVVLNFSADQQKEL